MKSLIISVTMLLSLYAFSGVNVHVQGFYESHNKKYVYLNTGTERITLKRKYLTGDVLKDILKNKDLETDVHIDPRALKGMKKAKPKKSTLRKIAAHKKRKAELSQK